MTDLSFVEVMGLVGVTLVVAVGKIFDGVRQWLGGFTFWANPLRWIGEAMSCTMCAGWWVGFGWGMYSGFDFVRAVVLGGLVSVAAYFTDELLAVVAAVSVRIVRVNRPRQAVPTQEPARVLRAPMVPDMEAPLSEEEANQIADAQEQE